MKYRPLLRLSLEHSYYPDGRCPDFEVQATVETQQALNNHRAVLRDTGAGIEILVPVDPAGAPFIELREVTDFVFVLRLRSAVFPAFTDLSPLVGIAAPVFSNPTAGTVTDLEPVSRDSFPKLPRGAFALAEIHHHQKPGALPSEPTDYRVRFEAKSAHWTYYCVTDLPRDRNELTIVDLGNGQPQGLVFADRTELESEPDPSDPIAGELAGRFPDLRRVRFVSDAPVACHAKPRKRLELQVNGQRLVGPLPNPPWLDFSVLPAVNGERPTFYHVVKHTTRPPTNNGG